MEVVYFKKEAGKYYFNCFYVPQLKIVIYDLMYEPTHMKDFDVDDRAMGMLLNQARIMTEHGFIIEEEYASFSNLKKFEYEDNKIMDLISNIKSRKELEEKIEKEIRSLINESKSHEDFIKLEER